MKQYVAIIRGINVGGHNRVNMKMLKDVLETLGLRDIRTYIQSGNVVFRSEDQDVEGLQNVFNEVLRIHFHADVPVIVRQEMEWLKTLRNNPFVKETGDHTKLLVTFLAGKPSQADVQALSEVSFPHDDFSVSGKDIYLYCRNGYGKTDIPNTFFEKKLGVTATTRNWRTVIQLAEMLKS